MDKLIYVEKLIFEDTRYC